MISTSASGDTAQFEVQDVPTPEGGSDAELPLESDTHPGASADQTITDQPVAPPQPFAQGYPPGAGWQYPPQYGQYPQYMPPGYPMPYPPGYPPGYGYPQQAGPYPPGYPQQPAPPPTNPGTDSGFPEIRLPNPEDTGVKEQPKPAAPVEGEAKPQEQTPSQRAAELINSRRRRRTDEEK